MTKRQIRQYVRSNEGVIEWFNNSDELRTLALYYLIRGRYKNPVIYNYSLRSASEKTGISISTLRTFVPRMIDLGIAQIRDGNLCLLSHNKLEMMCNGRLEAHKCTLDSRGKDIVSVMDMEKILLIKLVEMKARQIRYQEKKSKNLITDKRRNQQDSKKYFCEITGFTISMSVEIISKVIGRSKAATSKIIRWWKDNRYIDTLKVPNKAVQKVSKKAFAACADIFRKEYGYGYVYKGQYVVIEPNRYRFLSYPVW